jgi:lysozyme
VGQGGADRQRKEQQMNLDKLRQEIAEDEGCKYEIYLDHLGLPTTGIGHLIVESDPEHGQPIGTVVEQERVNQLFKLDMAVTIDECNALYSDFDELPEECQHIIANMMFNMGRPRLSKFVGMKAGVDARDWQKAADEMVDSRWYTQVPNRARRLVARMRGLADG